MKQQTLQEAWDDYAAHSRSMGVTASTLSSYASATRALLRDHGNRKLHLLTDSHIDQFMLAAAKTRSANSLGTTHSILSAFFNYCIGTGRIKAQQNPMFGRRRPSAVERDRLRIPVHQWPRLLDLAGARDPRDRMVVALGLYTLLRDQDMAALRVGDVDLNTGHIRTTITKSKTTDDVAISGDLDPEVRRWLTAYQSRIGTLHPDMFLVPRQRASRVRNDLTGRYIDGRTVGMPGEYVPFGQIRKLSYIVTPLIELMGYPVVDDNGNSLREGAHTLRRSGARAYYDYFVAQGRADALRVVQTMLHHKNSLMTQHYIGLREDRATRDELVRGVTIFGLHNLSRIGVADHGGEEGQRAVL